MDKKRFDDSYMINHIPDIERMPINVKLCVIRDTYPFIK